MLKLRADVMKELGIEDPLDHQVQEKTKKRMEAMKTLKAEKKNSNEK